MINSTLCYIERDGRYLMLFRNKKQNDLNEGKWIGVGGKFLPGETADECVLREVKEETGFTLTEYRFHGVIGFENDRWPSEAMHLYTATAFTAPEDCPTDENGLPLPDCNEGTLRWIPKEEIMGLPLWEGDRYFLRELLDGCDTIEMDLIYENDRLVRVKRGDTIR